MKLWEQTTGDSEPEKGANEPLPEGAYISNVTIEGEYISSAVKETDAWDVYNNEARKVDRELVKDWSTSLNFLLVFAAIFSAVLTAFIIESKKMLEQDPNELMADVMIFYTNSLANGTHTPYIRPDFQPSPSAISINCFLYGSLSASLVAALASVIALQWVADYDAAITRGGSSPQDRAKRRQFRFSGVEAWRMGGLIAAMPLLLNFSVVLFFAGVIQWTVGINFTVGCVVMVGGATALLFYVSSTILAVVFVSAPFKTPLSRWIYSIYHVSFLVLHWILTIFRMNSPSEWVDKHRQRYYGAYRREDAALELYTGLTYQAMNWLVRQVSISDDSRRRLVLVVAQLLEWPSVQLETPEFKDAPWISVLNFLAEKHRSVIHIQQQTRGEEEELAILVNCATLQPIYTRISPHFNKHGYRLNPENARLSSKFTEHDYWFNTQDARYWAQYCITDQGTRAPFDHFSTFLKTPDALFLLVRDLPVPSLRMTDEMETTLKLAKWRNSEKKSLEIWQEMFETTNTYSMEFFSGTVCLLYSNSDIFSHNPSNVERLRIDVIKAFARRAATTRISSAALAVLLRAFELLVDPYIFEEFSRSEGYIERPLSYGHNLQRRDEEMQQIHRTMTLLHARDLQGWSGPEVTRRFNDVLGMIWLSTSTRHYHDWRKMEKIYDFDCTMEDLQPEILQDWVFHVDNSPEIIETICLLLQASVTHPIIGIRWLSSCVEHGKDRLFTLLLLFDNLLREEQHYIPRSTILKALCRTLKTDDPRAFAPITVVEDSGPSVVALRSPYIRTIGYRALGIGSIDEAVPYDPAVPSELIAETMEYMFWNMSVEDPPSVWRLRAYSITNSSSDDPSSIVTRALEAALYSPEQLPKLERLFAHPTSCSHKPGPGHLLIHLHTNSKGYITYRPKTTLFGHIHLENCRLRPIIALLIIPDPHEISPSDLYPGFDEECISQLWAYFFEQLKYNRLEMLSFLQELVAFYAKMYWVYEPEALAIILKTIEEALELPAEGSSASVLLLLSQSLRLLSAMTIQNFSHRKQHPVFMLHTERVRNLVLTDASTKTIVGSRNLRSLACARAPEGICPANEWTSIYM